MTAKRLSRTSRIPSTRICTMMLPPISSGIITRLMMNALVLTAATYSRRATTSSLRMAVALRCRGRDADEDVVQRRPGQLEVPHRAQLNQPAQQRLPVRPTLQLQLFPAPEV